MAKKEKIKEPKLQTITSYRKWKAGKIGLFTGMFVCPMLPATVVTIINWDEWFAKSDTSLPFGFVSLLLTVIVAIIGILKSDTVFKKADIALYYLAGLFMCIGITCMFLASLFTQMGYMWIYTGAGLVASGACYTCEKKFIEPNLTIYKDLINNNLLDRKSYKQQQRIKRAEEDAKELEERRRRATTE